jgi:Mn2+/Fe2+ NRAMP family transporter
MAVLVTLTVGLVWWIVAWAFGIKAFDAFLLTVAMTLAAYTVVAVKPYVHQMLGRGPAKPPADRMASF